MIPNMKEKIADETSKFILNFWLTDYEKQYGQRIYNHINHLNNYLNKYNNKKHLENRVIKGFMNVQEIILVGNIMDKEHRLKSYALFRKVLLLNRNFNIAMDYSINFHKIDSFYKLAFDEITIDNFLTEEEILKILKKISKKDIKGK